MLEQYSLNKRKFWWVFIGKKIINFKIKISCLIRSFIIRKFAFFSFFKIVCTPDAWIFFYLISLVLCLFFYFLMLLLLSQKLKMALSCKCFFCYCCFIFAFVKTFYFVIVNFIVLLFNLYFYLIVFLLFYYFAACVCVFAFINCILFFPLTFCCIGIFYALGFFLFACLRSIFVVFLFLFLLCIWRPVFFNAASFY